MVVKFKHIKVLLTGSASAGKSSFCRLLFEEEFISDHIRTEIMETKQGLTMDKKTEGKTLPVQQGDQQAKETEKTDREAVTVTSYNMLSEAKWIKLNPNNQLGQIKTLLKNKMFHLRKSASDQSAQQEQEFGNIMGITDEQHTDMDDKITDSLPLPDYSELQEPIKMITVLDSGGQPEYVSLLPAINSMPTINFVVHDLTKNLEDRVQVAGKHEEAHDYLLNYSYFDMIQLLMCLITDSESFKQSPELLNPKQTLPQGVCISCPEKSYIGFIGTHYDKVKNDHKKLQEVNKKVEELTCKIENLSILSSENGKVLRVVDNTKSGNPTEEGLEVKAIRRQIQDLTDEMDDHELPISWMLLELEMQELRISGKKYITYDEYKEIGQKCFLTSEEEVETSLSHFHVLGIVLCFRNSALCDLHNLVIIDLQWLFTNLARIMHLSVNDFKSTTDHKLKKMFQEQKLLAELVLKNIQLKEITSQEIQYFIKLLTHLNVIANLTIDQVDYYYLSCGLPSAMQYNDDLIFLLSEPLLIRFSSGYLPRGFFCSLVALLLNEKQWQHQLGNTTAKHYSNVITFQLPDDTFLRLHDKAYFLEVQVRHYTIDVKIQNHSEILTILKKHLQAVCKQLHFDYEGIQYGFMCHANSGSCDHMAVWKPNEQLRCDGTPSHKTVIKDSYQLWFEVCNVIIVS